MIVESGSFGDTKPFNDYYITRSQTGDDGSLMVAWPTTLREKRKRKKGKIVG